jgi:thiosulfate/3-mercaptopyruvate sulfurtransferase
MKASLNLALALTGAAFSLVPLHSATAQKKSPAGSAMVVNSAWLKDHLHDANLVVLQVSSKAQFDTAHIPGARQVALSDISLAPNESKLSLELPAPSKLKAWAEANGIGNNTRVIVVPYDSTLQSSTRVFITLAYMGAMDRVSLLDGGLSAWRSANQAVTADATPAPKATVFDLKLRPDIIASMQDVERAVADHRTTIVDARLARFYNGDGGGYPRAGHIPTAINVPLNLVTEHGFLKDTTSLRKLFVDAGVTAGKPVVTYCHIGQQATLLWFVSTMLGYNARMYDGSFQEWSGTERLSVVGKPD